MNFLHRIRQGKLAAKKDIQWMRSEGFYLSRKGELFVLACGGLERASKVMDLARAYIRTRKMVH